MSCVSPHSYTVYQASIIGVEVKSRKTALAAVSAKKGSEFEDSALPAMV